MTPAPFALFRAGADQARSILEVERGRDIAHDLNAREGGAR